jgi:hypothetical protein
MSLLEAASFEVKDHDIAVTFTLSPTAMEDVAAADFWSLSVAVSGRPDRAPKRFGVKFRANERPNAYVSQDGRQANYYDSNVHVEGTSVVVSYPDTTVAEVSDKRITAVANVDGNDVGDEIDVTLVS